MILNFQGVSLQKTEHIEAGTGNYAIHIKLIEESSLGITLVVWLGFELNAVRIQFTSAKYHTPYGSWTDFNARQLTDLNSAEPWISPWCDELVLYFSADPYARFMVTANGPGDSTTSFGRTEVAIYEVETGGTETKLQANNETGNDYMIISDISYTGTTVLLGSDSQLPPYTLQLLYQDYHTPPFAKGTAVQVSQFPNIWNLTYENSDWTRLLAFHDSLLAVLNVNSTGVTNMQGMFMNCKKMIFTAPFDTSTVTNMGEMFLECNSLKSVPLFNTSAVTDMHAMLQSCASLKAVPLFDTSNVTDMHYMLFQAAIEVIPLFNTSKVVNTIWMLGRAIYVTTGALALYQQLSTQTTPPLYYSDTFEMCGYATEQGKAELAQIPDAWK